MILRHAGLAPRSFAGTWRPSCTEVERPDPRPRCRQLDRAKTPCLRWSQGLISEPAALRPTDWDLVRRSVQSLNEQSGVAQGRRIKASLRSECKRLSSEIWMLLAQWSLEAGSLKVRFLPPQSGPWPRGGPSRAGPLPCTRQRFGRICRPHEPLNGPERWIAARVTQFMFGRRSSS
jgi:hypothetical protein